MKTVTLATMAIVAIALPSINLGASGQGSAEKDLDQLSVSIALEDGSFSEALAALAQQTRMNLIADDVPMLKSARLHVQGTARMALDSISKRFDYSWRQTPHGDIILTKQFDDPFEHPQLLRKEAEYVAAIMARLLRGLGIRPGDDQMGTDLRALYSSFTEEQLAYADNGRRIPVRELRPDQQRIAVSAITEQGFGRVVSMWDTLGSELTGLETGTLQLAEGPRTGGQDPATDSSPPRAQDIILRWGRGARAHVTTIPQSHSEYGVQQFDGPVSPDSLLGEPGVLTESSEKALEKTFHIKNGETIISDMITQLVDQTGIKIVVANPIRAHKVIVQFGSLTTPTALSLICETIGANRRTLTSDRIAIFIPDPPNVHNVSDIFHAVFAGLPPAWQRFLAHLPADPNPESPRSVYSKKAGLYESKVALPKRSGQIAALARAYADRLVSAIREGAGKDGKLKYSDLSEELRADLASCIILDALDQFCRTPCAGNILYGKLLPYQADPSSAEVSIKDGGISIGSTFERGGNLVQTGFAASVQTPRP